MARQILVEILGDESKFNRSIDSATSKTGGFSNVLKGVGMGIGLKAFDMLGTAVSTVTDFIGDSVTAASNLEQSMGAVESVFGDTSDTIFDFGEKAADALGLSRREVNEMGAVLGAQLKSMGFNMEQAADTTMDLTSRAADMAATFGGSTKDAVEAIGSLMRGERDPIEKYGVSIKQADVNARILALGLDTSSAAAQKNAEAVATMDLLMEQTAATQGQFASESDSVAGSQARAQAKFENVSAALGEKLLPIMTALMGFVNDVLLPGFINVIDWVGAMSTEIGRVWSAITGYVSTASHNIGNFIAGIRSAFGTVSATIARVGDSIRGTWNSIVSFIGGIPSRIGNAVSGMWNSVWTGFKNIINTVIRAWNNLGFHIPRVDVGPIHFGGGWVGTPDIPYLHAGGIVPGVPGSDVPAILQAGERVIPRRDVGGGGITINIENFTGSDSDIDRLADRLAMRLRLKGV